MRWENLTEKPAAGPDGGPPGDIALFGTDAVFRGITFHEVRARSIVNRVPGASRMPFERTANPYRGSEIIWVCQDASRGQLSFRCSGT